MGPRPGRLKVAWHADGAKTGAVFVSAGPGPETLFAAGERGEQEAAWLQTGIVYRIRLYTGPDRAAVLAEVEVIYQ